MPSNMALTDRHVLLEASLEKHRKKVPTIQLKSRSQKCVLLLRSMKMGRWLLITEVDCR